MQSQATHHEDGGTASLNALVLSVGKLTHIGQVRTRNEDYMGLQLAESEGAPNIFVVADGMGGHSAGNVASQMAVESTLQQFAELTQAPLSDRLRLSIEAANRSIFTAAQSNSAYFRMGTTIVGVVVDGNQVDVASVGDSRVYIVRNDIITQITRDHSWVALQVEMGELTPEEAQVSQNRSVLLRCLGEKIDVQVDLVALHARQGDRLILCSDGLHGLVTAEEIKQLALSSEPQKACEDLVDLANARGGMDNITVQIVRFDECPPPPDNESEEVVLKRASRPEPLEEAVPFPEFGSSPEVPMFAAVPLLPSPLPSPPPVSPPPAPPTPPTSAPWTLPALLAVIIAIILAATLFLRHSTSLERTAPPGPSAASTASLAIPAASTSPLSEQDQATGTAGLPGPHVISPDTPASPLSSNPNLSPPPPLENGTVLNQPLHNPSALVSLKEFILCIDGTSLRVCGSGDSPIHVAATLRCGDAQHTVTALATDGNSTLYAIAGKTLRCLDLPSLLHPQFRTLCSLPVASRWLAATPDTFFWVDEQHEALNAASIPTGTTALTNHRILARYDGKVTGMVVLGNKLYWAIMGKGVFGLATDASPSRQVPQPLFHCKPSTLATDGAALYWTEKTPSSNPHAVNLFRYQGGSGTPDHIATLTGPATCLAVSATTIFWSTPNGHGPRQEIHKLSLDALSTTPPTPPDVQGSAPPTLNNAEAIPPASSTTTASPPSTATESTSSP